MRVYQLVICGALAFSATPCLAGPSDSVAKTAEFKEAIAFYEADDAPKAYQLLSKMFASNPTYDVATVLGQVEEKLGKYRDAAEHYEFGIRFAPVGKSEKIDKGIGRTKELLAVVKKRIVTLKVSVEPGAEITLDGKVMGTSPLPADLFVEPGEHFIRASHPTNGAAEQKTSAQAGEERTVSLVLWKELNEKPATLRNPPAELGRPQQKPNETGAISSSGQVSPSGLETKKIVLIVGGAVTLAAAGTATFFGIRAMSARSDADSLLDQAKADFGKDPCSSSAGKDSPICNRVKSKLDSRSTAASVFNVMLPVAGVAAVATGLVYVFWPDKKSNSAKNMTLIPIAQPQLSGLVLQGKF
jgi:hypothetical protein